MMSCKSFIEKLKMTIEVLSTKPHNIPPQHPAHKTSRPPDVDLIYIAVAVRSHSDITLHLLRGPMWILSSTGALW